MCSVCYQRLQKKEHPGRQYSYTRAWRRKNLGLRNRQRSRNYQRGAQHATNNGQPYDDFDDQMILDKTIVNDQGKVLKENVCDRELARFLGRTVLAIQAHRCYLKKCGD